MSMHIAADARPDDGPPLRYADLEAYFHAGAKPRAAWRVGLECEKFALERGTGRSITYDEPDGIRDILRALTRFGWQPHYEGDDLTALSRDGATVSLEPGGQVEFSTPPLARLADIAAELARHRTELRSVAKPHIIWVSAGATPFDRVDAIPLGRRPRHRVMADYLPTRSPTALAMMKATASTQVALDYASEADAVAKFDAALRLGPMANALWANAAYFEGQPSGHASTRGRIWQGMDPDRSGVLVPLLESGLSFARWVDYLLDVPMLFAFRDGHYHPANGATFRHYLADGIGGAFPTRADWELHLTTVFPDVRLKHFLEVRGADATPMTWALALPAFWKGLLYDATALDAAGQLARSLAPRALPALGAAVGERGLHATHAGRPVAAWCAELVDLAEAGLRRLGEDAAYLEPLRRVLAGKPHVARHELLASLEF